MASGIEVVGYERELVLQIINMKCKKSVPFNT
jgi:hypothetical protein